MPTIKKLIEVALPLEAINAESAREKSIRHGHPSTLHLWWARRPLATARAVIWSSLVDDPSSHPEQFPTEEAQQQERERLFGILTRLVKWENSNDEGILAEAKAEIMKSTNGNPPALLDPFAGGGAIPLEAQRLGLEAHAHDLNPVAVMINKAMIEIPPKFAGRSPVNPEAQRQGAANQGWKGAAGLAEDVRYYGEWMKQEACKRIGHLYPKAKLEDGSEATVIAWIWARTVKCPNPACGCEMPLVRSFTLSKKKGHEAWIKATYTTDGFEYTVQQGSHKEEGTVDRKGATCLKCGSSVDFPYIRNAGKNGQMNSKLIAVVAEGSHGRVYLSANSEQLHAAIVVRPEDYPDAKLPKNPRDFKTPNYGLTTFADLFTNRQLTALTTFSSLVSEAQQKAEADAVAAGVFNDHIALSEGGSGARAYGEAVGVYLAFGVSRMTDIDNALCRWEVTKTQVRNLFSRQAIPMVWDYAENNVFNNAAGDYTTSLGSIIKVIERFEQQKRERYANLMPKAIPDFVMLWFLQIRPIMTILVMRIYQIFFMFGCGKHSKKPIRSSSAQCLYRKQRNWLQRLIALMAAWKKHAISLKTACSTPAAVSMIIRGMIFP